MSTVALVSLARRQAMGEVRRVGVVASALHRGGRRRRRSGRHPRPPTPTSTGWPASWAGGPSRAARVVRSPRPHRAAVARARRRRSSCRPGPSIPRWSRGPGPSCSTRLTAWPAATAIGPTWCTASPAARSTEHWPPPTRDVERRLQASDLRRVAAGWTDAAEPRRRMGAQPARRHAGAPTRRDARLRRALLRHPPLPAEHRRARALAVLAATPRAASGDVAPRGRRGAHRPRRRALPPTRLGAGRRLRIAAGVARAPAVGRTAHTRRRHPEQGARRRVPAASPRS